MDWTFFVSSWTGIVAIILCTIVGLLMASATAISHWHTKTIAWASVAFAALGIFLSTVSKWTEIAIKYNDYEIKIAKIESENKNVLDSLNKLQIENKNLNFKLASFDAFKNDIQAKPVYVRADNKEWFGILSNGGVQDATASKAISAMQAAGWAAIKPNDGAIPEWDTTKSWNTLNGVLVTPEIRRKQ
jgi:hypothetical protein